MDPILDIIEEKWMDIKCHISRYNCRPGNFEQESHLPSYTAFVFYVMEYHGASKFTSTKDTRRWWGEAARPSLCLSDTSPCGFPVQNLSCVPYGLGQDFAAGHLC